MSHWRPGRWNGWTLTSHTTYRVGITQVLTTPAKPWQPVCVLLPACLLFMGRSFLLESHGSRPVRTTTARVLQKEVGVYRRQEGELVSKIPLIVIVIVLVAENQSSDSLRIYLPSDSLISNASLKHVRQIGRQCTILKKKMI